jgi:sodium transport system permease protein
MKSNIWTIIKKEFARFFGDRQLIFTAVIMPGLLIYLIYSLIGTGINSMISDSENQQITLQVENMPESMSEILLSYNSPVCKIELKSISDEDIKMLENKEVNALMIRFPANFDQQVENYYSLETESIPNIEIYYNSANIASKMIYEKLYESIMSFERGYQINESSEEGPTEKYDVATDSIDSMIWSKILPMLIMMMLFSGVMAIAPSSIAGEKERGTIATLLVTPMKRNDLALGKIVSLSCIALLSGTSSFIGIALSLPNMIQTESAELGLNYTFNDYIALMFIIFASVLIMASAVSLLSALAKDVKNAGTMITPFMLVVMVCGLMPLMQESASENPAVYAIPFYNSIEAMTAVFAHKLHWGFVTITLGANIAFTAIATWALTKMFNSEKVMFSK